MKLRSLAFVIMLFPIIVSAYDFELDGIYYNIMSTTDLTVSVTNSGINKDPWGNISGKDYSGNLTIPDKVVLSGRTLTVVDISTYAFNESNIESIILPNSIKSISCSAFEASKSLKEIKIPASVEFIGSFAFGNCSSLKKIIIEDSDSPLGIDVTNSYAGIFRLCPIEELYIGRDIDRRISLGESSWYDNNLSPFGFQELKSENLIITIGPKVKSLCDCIFKYGKGLAIVNIPETVEYIGKSAFEGCSQLKEVNILSKLTVIPSSAFCGCESLETIILPNSIKTIQSSAFKDCSSLKSVNLGNSLSLIGVNSFKSCSSLEKITLPRSLEKIVESAFDQCSSLTSITVLSYTPPQAAENSFSTIAYWNATLVVPYGTKTLYEAMDCWKNFSNIDEDMSDIAKYHLYYCVDGEEYKSYEIEYGATITPEPNPTKEYYTFSGWSEIPETMPANDVTVTGSFTKNETTEAITIGKSGKASYWCDKNLDFSKTDEIKAFVVSGYDYQGETSTIYLTRVKDVPAGTPIIVKGTAGTTYKIPIKASSSSYYENMLKGNTTGSPITLNPTEGDYMNMVMSGGQFWAFGSPVSFPANMSYLQLPKPEAMPSATPGSSQTVNITNDKGKVTLCSTVDLDFSSLEGDGVKAFTVTGYDNSSSVIWLTRVTRASAGVGLIVKGPQGEYSVPSSGAQTSYANMLVGNNSGSSVSLDPSDEIYTHMVMSKGEFLSFGSTIDFPSGMAYLRIPKAALAMTRSAKDDTPLSSYSFTEEPEVISMTINTRSIGGEGDTTGIREVKSEGVNSEKWENGEWYTLQGQRVAKPGKGLYIHNGKKVLVTTSGKAER